MVSRLRDSVRLPVIAAGGIATPAHVRGVLEAGAVAAQIGTALLRTPESGAHPVHKAALVDPAFTATTDPRLAMFADPRSGTTGDSRLAETADPRPGTTGDPRLAETADPRPGTTGDPRLAETAGPRSGTTIVTRAFTGRPARALRNEFTVRFDGAAPWAYPEIHYVTKPLRDAAAARGDAGGMALWAGINHAMAQARPAAEVIVHLAEAKMA
jgi:nitronate monooxygenase